MSNITITIAAPELAAAINNLANAIAAGQGIIMGSQQPQMPAPLPWPAATPAAAPAAPAAPVATTPPVAPAAPAAPTAPTTAPTYTQQDLVLAASPLMDAGKQNELKALLAQFGVQSLMQLPPEHYGAFATGLRGLGAKI